MIGDSSSENDAGSSCEEEFGLVKNYNLRILAIYEGKLMEKVLDALAYHASYAQLKRERLAEAE